MGPAATKDTFRDESGYPRRMASSALRGCAKRSMLSRSPRRGDPCPEMWMRHSDANQEKVKDFAPDVIVHAYIDAVQNALKLGHRGVRAP